MRPDWAEAGEVGSPAARPREALRTQGPNAKVTREMAAGGTSLSEADGIVPASRVEEPIDRQLAIEASRPGAAHPRPAHPALFAEASDGRKSFRINMMTLAERRL